MQLSRALRTTQALGLASRDNDPDHGKRVLVALTPRGREVYQRVLKKARRAQAELLLHLSAGERKQLFVALHKLQAAAELGD